MSIFAWETVGVGVSWAKGKGDVKRASEAGQLSWSAGRTAKSRQFDLISAGALTLPGYASMF